MATSLMGGRRSAVEIVHEILSLCDDGGLNKTGIMYKVNLSYDQLQKYLGALCDEELIFKNTYGQFHTTASGEKTLDRMTNAISTLRDLRCQLGAAAD